ncbi:type II toxin-antitoxin system VapC family toxin [Algoriphagus winogradskyi]|uniref:Predicted nucleic acid-binding protein, contains PIN domain n=1 Tax=Algoriphagus winogradskyi TaxID=237017 RepID=A0ABY1PL01_9BACT|nr:type II toxin-antitoxin system VapC family toxin [Algoriphagus winogradskyi]SMP36532.1 Predicted nucleic acid-binding protein, contains PIN domain [Algoriphagus winogradskyi]
MKKILLDTSLILHYMRGDATFRKVEEEHHLLTDPGSIILLSAISIGEIEGFFLRKDYGEKQTERWRKLLEKSIILSIDGRDEKLMQAYAAIQGYCQNNHPRLNAANSKIIGQNDMWIAATTYVINATLFTKDKDFVHLKDVFIKLVTID